MRRGKFNPERWKRARELAAQGYTVCAGARLIGIHHATAIYIAEQMGFKWAGSMKGKYPRQETMGRVEKLMRLANGQHVRAYDIRGKVS
jgi:hypothetical protein